MALGKLHLRRDLVRPQYGGAVRIILVVAAMVTLGCRLFPCSMWFPQTENTDACRFLSSHCSAFGFRITIVGEMPEGRHAAGRQSRHRRYCRSFGDRAGVIPPSPKLKLAGIWILCSAAAHCLR